MRRLLYAFFVIMPCLSFTMGCTSIKQFGHNDRFIHKNNKEYAGENTPDNHTSKIDQEKNSHSFSKVYDSQSSDVIDESTSATKAEIEESDIGETTDSVTDNQEEEEKSDSESAESPQDVLDTALSMCETAQDLWSAGNLDKALETLDDAYSLTVSVDPGQDSKLTREKEDLRFTISKRIIEIYSSRHTSVTGSCNEIPLTLNEHVKKEIRLFQTVERNFFLKAYARSGKYREEIVKELNDAGLPEELSWLPLIESGFNPVALSRARALGLWQFIPSTGYMYGLKRDAWVDERMDAAKSTKAAIAYLKELHSIFGDWSTVLAAYNCGEGAVLRVIRSQQINYLDNFWDLYEKLPNETARYVPRFLATLLIINDQEKYGIDLGEAEAPIASDTITIQQPIHLKSLSQALGCPYETLTTLNPELRYSATPPNPYPLRVPAGEGESLLAQIDNLPKWSLPQPTAPSRSHNTRKSTIVYHKVKKGDTLQRVAERYDVSVKILAKFNGLSRKRAIHVGQALKIPLPKDSPNKSFIVASEVVPPAPVAKEYKVKRGDSLHYIAQRLNTTPEAIKSLNRLKSSRLSIGQTLKIPSRAIMRTSEKGKTSKKGMTAQKGKKEVYLVQRGDNLAAIAKKHQMDLEKLLNLNNLSQKSTIYPGQRISVE
ncbi:MAG: LysM peptidoglycan-binding domain-containing protein [Pseudomonadota bacterium]